MITSSDQIYVKVHYINVDYLSADGDTAGVDLLFTDKVAKSNSSNTWFAGAESIRWHALRACDDQCSTIGTQLPGWGVQSGREGGFWCQCHNEDLQLGLAMRLRIHAVHADDPHMRICASRCACKNLDADQPHIEQKRVLQRQILQIHVVWLLRC